LVFGCSGAVRNRADAEDALRTAAAPEMSCPERDLALVVLSDDPVPTRYAVEGCGTSAVFADGGTYDWEREEPSD
jgi:hypothetical protein